MYHVDFLHLINHNNNNTQNNPFPWPKIHFFTYLCRMIPYYEARVFSAARNRGHDISSQTKKIQTNGLRAQARRMLFSMEGKRGTLTEHISNCLICSIIHHLAGLKELSYTC